MLEHNFVERRARVFRRGEKRTEFSQDVYTLVWMSWAKGRGLKRRSRMDLRVTSYV